MYENGKQVDLDLVVRVYNINGKYGYPKFMVEFPNVHQIVNKVLGRNLWLKISCVEKHSCRNPWLKIKNMLQYSCKKNSFGKPVGQ